MVEKSCGAVVYRIMNQEVQYLILKSSGRNSYWRFAKGHMEESESEQETCIREVFEETGIQIVPEEFRMVDTYWISNTVKKEVVLFLGNAADQPITLQQEEIMDYCWCRFDEAEALLTYESAKKQLRQANQFLLLSCQTSDVF